MQKTTQPERAVEDAQEVSQGHRDALFTSSVAMFHFTSHPHPDTTTQGATLPTTKDMWPPHSPLLHIPCFHSAYFVFFLCVLLSLFVSLLSLFFSLSFALFFSPRGWWRWELGGWVWGSAGIKFLKRQVSFQVKVYIDCSICSFLTISRVKLCYDFY